MTAVVSIELLYETLFYDQIAKNVMHFFLSASFCLLFGQNATALVYCLMENTCAFVPRNGVPTLLLTTLKILEIGLKSPLGSIIMNCTFL